MPLRGAQVDGAGQSKAVNDERLAPLGTGSREDPIVDEGFGGAGVPWYWRPTRRSSIADARLGLRQVVARAAGPRRRSALLVPGLPCPLPQGRLRGPGVTEAARDE